MLSDSEYRSLCEELHPRPATWFFATIGFLGTLVLPSLYEFWNSDTHRLASMWTSCVAPLVWVKAHLGWHVAAFIAVSMGLGATLWIAIGTWLIFLIFVKPLVMVWRLLGVCYLIGGLVVTAVFLGLSGKTMASMPFGRPVAL